MTIRVVLFSVMTVLLVAAWMRVQDSGSVSAKSSETPVLVELFTSEGCSSCPPADKFLQKLDQQPIAGAQVIVLSEHVDYWNHIGWKDPYSAHFYSERQSSYARRFELDSVYTPQMVIDGVREFVGSNTAAADKALAEAIAVPKLAVHLALTSANSKVLQAHVETGSLEPSFGVRDAEVYMAIALNRAESQVSSGENAGHRLSHVAVVRELRKIGIVKLGQSLSQDVPLDQELTGNARLIAFVQEHKQGKVLGVAQLLLRGNELERGNQ
jgi:hypothetical protein